jgi:hypothetical protein
MVVDIGYCSRVTGTCCVSYGLGADVKPGQAPACMLLHFIRLALGLVQGIGQSHHIVTCMHVLQRSCNMLPDGSSMTWRGINNTMSLATACIKHILRVLCVLGLQGSGMLQLRCYVTNVLGCHMGACIVECEKSST